MSPYKTITHFPIIRSFLMWLAVTSIIVCNMACGETKESRCASAAPPPEERREITANLPVQAPSPMKREPASVTITVYFHILTSNDGRGNVTDDVVRQQIDLLNTAFAGGQGGAATPFKFKLADVDGIDRTSNDEWFEMVFLDSPSEVERTAKTALNKGDKSVLNIYTANLSGIVLGWARWPWDLADGVDGVVIGFQTLPGGTILNRDRGDTLIHEVGHWLGLFHTYENGCDGVGDEVEDTTPEGSPGRGCEPEDTCPDSSGFDPVENFMDDSHDECRFLFTQGQSDRMDAMHLAYRT
jgi:hypothetical protein